MDGKKNLIVADTIKGIVNGDDIDTIMDCLMLASFNYDYLECTKHSEVDEITCILQAEAPQFAKFEPDELREIEAKIVNAVKERIKDENLTFEETFRLLVTYIILSEIKEDGAYTVPEGNSKVRICDLIFTAHCSMCFMEKEIQKGIEVACGYDC